MSLSSSVGTKAPTQFLEERNFRLSTRFPEHHLVSSPPANHRKVTYSAALTPNFALKNSSSQTIEEFGFF